MSELNIRIRKLQDNGSTFRATPETLYMGGVGSARVDTLRFEVPEEWNGCAISLHVKRLSGALPDPQLLDENHCVVVDKRWTKEKQGSWMLLAMNDAGYIAMTKPGQYTCYETIDLNSTTETITQSLYEQLVAVVLNYANQALASRNAAGEKAEEAKGHADRAERAAAHAESLLNMNEVLLRLTELAADPLKTADGDALETAGGIPLEASVRVIRTAHTLDEAEYLPVSLGLLKQCLGGLTPAPPPGTTTATLGKAVVGRMVLGTT